LRGGLFVSASTIADGSNTSSARGNFGNAGGMVDGIGNTGPVSNPSPILRTWGADMHTEWTLPLPGSDLDPIGPVLRELDNSTTELQVIDPKRLIGDRITIDSAILALMLVRQRIDEAEAAYRMDAAE
jgi:hypothetical protein